MGKKYLVYKEDFDAHIGSKENPHEVNKEQVGLGDVPNVATNDQTPTYTQATTLATLSSGEKLSVSFGKIMKAITDFIRHIGNKVSGNRHIPSGGASGQILRWSADGTAAWGSDNNTEYSAMTGATTSAAGKAGLVPAPAKGTANRYLRSDGTWQVPPNDNTTYTLSSFGVEVTAAELNHMDGVTGNVQAQINNILPYGGSLTGAFNIDTDYGLTSAWYWCHITSSTTGTVPMLDYGILEVIRNDGKTAGAGIQRFTSYSTGRVFVRMYANASWGGWREHLNTDKIVNNLATTSSGYVLDARQGKVLSDRLPRYTDVTVYLAELTWYTSNAGMYYSSAFPIGSMTVSQVLGATIKDFGTISASVLIIPMINDQGTGLRFLSNTAGFHDNAYLHLRALYLL